MRIRIVVAGAPGAVLGGRPWPDVGDVVDDLPTALAAHLVASGVAEEVTAAPRGRRKSRKESEG
ncbi:hypothetical protein [Streptomyces sp. NPDC006997]|uniref:hypothetical protein n=1 Tax=Streptomyces sp. NPDC006997 TaxID=3155356 RepID=UPI0033EE54A5